MLRPSKARVRPTFAVSTEANKAALKSPRTGGGHRSRLRLPRRDGSQAGSRTPSRAGTASSINSRASRTSRASRASLASTARTGITLGSANSGQSLAEASLANEPMPFRPWCGRCQPMKPNGILPLRTTDLDVATNATLCAAEQIQRLGNKHKGLKMGRMLSLREPTTPQASQRLKPSKLHLFKMRMRQMARTAEEAGAIAAKPGEAERDISSLKLTEGPRGSRFSREKTSKDHTGILARFTEWDIGELERWAITHCKRQHIALSVASHNSLPKEKHRQHLAMRHATLCQLVRRLARGALSDQERDYLSAKIKDVPLFKDIPEELLGGVMQALQACSFPPGTEVLSQGEKAAGVHILMQGELELTNELLNHDTLGAVITREAPAVILLEDVLEDNQDRPFLLRVPEEMVWSRTAATPITDESASVNLTLFVPLEALEKISEYFRDIETQVLEEYVAGPFAKSLRLPPQMCAGHCHLFKLERHDKNTVLFNEGVKPGPETRIALILQGEVRLLCVSMKSPGDEGKPNRRASLYRRLGGDQEFLGPGKVLDDAPIYGEAHAHTAICASETVELLSIKATDFLEKFLLRRVPLDRRPAAAAAVAASASGLGILEDEAEGASARARMPATGAVAASILAECRRVAKVGCDAAAVKSCEWKLVRPKGDLPQRRAPRGPQVASGRSSMEDRTRPGRGPGFAFDCSSSLPASRGSSRDRFSHRPYIVALDAKIARTAAEARCLEVEHLSHVDHGFHVEDAEGALPTASLLSPAPGRTVLFSCGARACEFSSTSSVAAASQAAHGTASAA
eukprot:CAMPEP_0170624102 /NCGR_PEP_ID=MMETSP0224-20130122/30053_1 /TAXON_ID=285029 /ORGANISM="Togula jolla, Strain CCCM 725" /LENGTH=801 /DNA_ID=CAMNT_0010950601 /DNA_START=1 /DNA_END=2406 /DNA_ORIENTATION=+